MRRLRSFLFCTLVSAAACSDTTAPAVAVPEAPNFAKPVPAANRLTSHFWAVGTESSIQTDNRYTSTIAGYSEYRHGVCGVKGNIQIENRGGDSFFQPNWSWTQKDKATCVGGATARRVTVVYRDDPSTPDVDEGTWAPDQVAYLHVRRLYYVGNNDWGAIVPYDPSEPIIANWIYTMDIHGGNTCGGLWFNPVRNPGSSLLLITPATVNGTSGWDIRTDESAGHKAWCENKGRTVSVPFVLLVQDLGTAG